MRSLILRFLGTSSAPIGGAFTLDAVQGSYTTTGNAVGVTVARQVPINSGTYIHTGNAVDLNLGRQILINNGSYTYTGNAIVIAVDRQLPLSPGTYNQTGFDAALELARSLSITTGNYAQTGFDVGLDISYQLTFVTGNYAQTGFDTILTANYSLDAVSGSYVYTGFAVGLDYSPVLPPGDFILNIDKGVYLQVEQDVGLIATRALIAEQVTYIYTGFDVDLVKALANELNIDLGIYTYTGFDVGLTVAAAYNIDLASGSYSQVGFDTPITHAAIAPFDTGNYIYTGFDVILEENTVAVITIEFSEIVTGSGFAGVSVYSDSGNIFNITGVSGFSTNTLTFTGTWTSALAGVDEVTADHAATSSNYKDTVGRFLGNLTDIAVNCGAP